METVDYEKLRMDVLKKLIEERGIDCKQTKDEIITHLKLDDSGKYIYPTTQEKNGKDGYIIGVDLKNHTQLVELGKRVEKKEAVRVNMYNNNRIYYITKETFM